MSPRASRRTSRTLEDRFRFAEDSVLAGEGSWRSRLRPAIDVESGERCLVRLFPKTGTAIDDDLRQLFEGGLRKIRRAISSRRAREILVEVVEIVEDEHELGVVMLDPGVPLSGSRQAALTRRQLCLANGGRRTFWRNMARVVEALTHCHDAGIVHGAVGEHSIFVRDDDAPSYRLGGYEACVHIADTESFADEAALRTSGPISFRHDLVAVGNVAAAALGLGQPGAPVLSSIEQRMLNRMVDPPRFQLYDGHVALSDMSEVIEELDRIGSSIEGELVLYPARSALRADLPALTSGTIPADDGDAVTRFIADDLLGLDTRAVVDERGAIRIVTDLATYKVEVVDGRIGMITEGAKRRPHDRVAEAFEVKRRIHLARNRVGADERVRKLGNGALAWAALKPNPALAAVSDDPPSWHALLLLEAFSLLRQQFKMFPVDVLAPPSGKTDLIWISLRSDPDREARRERLDLLPMGEALKRAMAFDEGKPNWTLSESDQLGRPRDRVPELVLEETGIVGGRQAYGFGSSEPVVPGQQLYLRPRADAGTDSAIRRRARNIVAARANVELLRAIDDPASVAVDDALRDVAAPGKPPEDLDPSKKDAWEAIAAGRSINVVVGPPGVGKTFLIAHLVRSILLQTPSARILVASQNHETLVTIHHELAKRLTSLDKIVVRVEKSDVGEEASILRGNSRGLLVAASTTDPAGPLENPYREIRQALRPTDKAEQAVAERVLRDTDNLLLRSSDVLLATTSSYAIQEMIEVGDQFDWVFAEEAARANGAELIGALLLGNRRVMIGDHRQLSPFESAERQEFYEPSRADDLLNDASERLSAIQDLPPEMDATLELLKSDSRLLIDVLSTAARLEEPFRSVAEREEERRIATGRSSSIAQMLLEQNRMHRAICQVVSNTFYDGKLVPSDRVLGRKLTVACEAAFPPSPIVVLDLPSLGESKIAAFEERDRKALTNPVEAAALIGALADLRPDVGPKDETPSLVILTPYSGQVTFIERLVRPMVAGGLLQGFVSPRGDGRFVYTSDSFQGGEADVVLASLVRNNIMTGRPALGFLKNPQRWNVLLSRARQKLVLAMSLRFFSEAVDGTDPDRLGGSLGFVRKLIGEVRALSVQVGHDQIPGSTILQMDERGNRVR